MDQIDLTTLESLVPSELMEVVNKAVDKILNNPDNEDDSE